MILPRLDKENNDNINTLFAILLHVPLIFWKFQADE